MDEEAQKLFEIKDSKERERAITSSKFFEGSNYELYKEILDLKKFVSWDNVDVKAIQAVYCKWIQHGKLSIDYKFKDFK